MNITKVQVAGMQVPFKVKHALIVLVKTGAKGI